MKKAFLMQTTVPGEYRVDVAMGLHTLKTVCFSLQALLAACAVESISG